MLKKAIYWVACCMFSMSCHAQVFMSGQDYDVLPDPATAKPSVVEFFSYGCPACAHIEPNIQKWVTAHQHVVEFSRVPVVFHAEWLIYAKAYYAADALNVLPQANEAIFKAIHKNHQPLDTNEAMVQFFVSQLGVNKTVAENALLNSTAADMAVKEGMAQMGQFGIDQVPTFVVNGHYKTNLKMAKSVERLTAVLDFLVTQQ